MKDVLDLERYPLDRPDSAEYRALIDSCKRDMAASGLFNLHGFVRPAAVKRAMRDIQSRSDAAFTHERRHNVYFEDAVAGLPPDHGALMRFDTIHHTLCDDQLRDTLVHEIYEWAPLAAFLARVLDKPRLFLMRDPLARVNVVRYKSGEALNWHFDRSLFTTTLLIQESDEGGEFEYRSNLRSDADPNYDGVAQVLRGGDREIRVNPLSPGTLNVFAGKNTLHRVSPVRGQRDRVVAVYSYYEQPNVAFNDEERIGFTAEWDDDEYRVLSETHREQGMLSFAAPIVFPATPAMTIAQVDDIHAYVIERASAAYASQHRAGGAP